MVCKTDNGGRTARCVYSLQWLRLPRWSSRRPRSAGAGPSRAGADVLRLRPEPPVRGRTAPRYRHRSLRRRRSRRAGPGSISFAGTVPAQGKTITIQTADGYSVTLVHLGSYSVRRGASVSERDVVGAVGASGAPELAGAVRAPRGAAHGRAAGLRRPALAASRAGGEPSPGGLGRRPPGAAGGCAAVRRARPAGNGPSTCAGRPVFVPTRARPGGRPPESRVVRPGCHACEAGDARSGHEGRGRGPCRQARRLGDGRAGAGQSGSSRGHASPRPRCGGPGRCPQDERLARREVRPGGASAEHGCTCFGPRLPGLRARACPLRGGGVGHRRARGQTPQVPGRGRRQGGSYH